MNKPVTDGIRVNGPLSRQSKNRPKGGGMQAQAAQNEAPENGHRGLTNGPLASPDGEIFRKAGRILPPSFLRRCEA